jgi:polysaccharide export outer membrane protein
VTNQAINHRFGCVLASGLLTASLGMSAAAQVPPGQTTPPQAAVRPNAAVANTAVAPTGVTLPAGYIIGPDDVLSILFWRDKDMSVDVTVRPDGRITLPLINDVQAAGLTTDQLHDSLMKAAAKYIEDPNVTVSVKAINSRKVFITGNVSKPGAYLLSGPTTVMQLIALSGGLLEFADRKKIIVMRTENGKPVAYPFNYRDVLKRKNLKQNIELKPGDTVVVP